MVERSRLKFFFFVMFVNLDGSGMGGILMIEIIRNPENGLAPTYVLTNITPGLSGVE